MKRFETEAELAEVVVHFLQDAGYEVFQEVELFPGAQRVDIVARHGTILWAIETKLSLSLAVLEQAWRNRAWFHYSSIAVPTHKRLTGRDFAVRAAGTFGLGVLTVSSTDEVHESEAALFNRKAMTSYVRLVEEQKYWAKAGNADGVRWSPFQSTKRELINYVREHEECKLKDALENIRHHYRTMSTATSSIRKWIQDGVIKELRIEKGKLYLREPEGASASD